MANRITDEGRRKQKRGTGSRATWIPWHQVQDFGGKGRKAKIPSMLFKDRTIHTMSSIEANLVFLAEMAKGVVDLREQFPLDLVTTKLIASKMGIKHPISEDRKSEVMTIDLWIDFEDQSPLGISVKDYTELKNKRTIEKLQLEKAYCEELNSRWKLITNRDMPPILVANIRMLRAYTFKVSDTQSLYLEMIREFKDTTKSLTQVNSEISRELRITRGEGTRLFKQLCSGKKITFNYFNPLNPAMPLSSFQY